MTEIQISKSLALMKCRFPVGSNQKRFAANMAGIARSTPDKDITDGQASYLDLLFHQYRRQIPQSHNRLCYCPEAEAARSQMKLLEKP